MKIYLIAGEASGDLHASNLLKALKKRQPALECRAWGGDLLQKAGATLVKHYRDLAFMGFVEVIKNLRTILSNLDFCKRDILDFQPDVLVLVDYPGFNLRVAKWARRQGLRVVYYISPQIWAWHRSRVHDIRRDVDQMLVILPFEKDFYQQYNFKVEFVGHPLLDAVADFENSQQPQVIENQKIVALLAGSRRQEVSQILPRMLEVVPHFPNEKFVVAGANSLPADFYKSFLKDFPQVGFEQGKTYELLRRSRAALVKSGTSTLETALFGVPQVVCYTGNPLSYFIAKRLVDIKFIALPNLILDRPLVRELIQNELNFNNLKQALTEILDERHAAEIREGYRELRQILGEGGASDRAADLILG